MFNWCSHFIFFKPSIIIIFYLIKMKWIRTRGFHAHSCTCNDKFIYSPCRLCTFKYLFCAFLFVNLSTLSIMFITPVYLNVFTITIVNTTFNKHHRINLEQQNPPQFYSSSSIYHCIKKMMLANLCICTN